MSIHTNFFTSRKKKKPKKNRQLLKRFYFCVHRKHLQTQFKEQTTIAMKACNGIAVGANLEDFWIIWKSRYQPLLFLRTLICVEICNTALKGNNTTSACQKLTRMKSINKTL